MVSWLFQLLLLFMFKFAMLCHVNLFIYSTYIAILGLIQMCECALNWFTMELVYKPKLDICHLCCLGATYLKHVCCWSLQANDSQLIWKFAWHSNATSPKHLPLDFLVGHVLVGVSPCGSCAIVTSNCYWDPSVFQAPLVTCWHLMVLLSQIGVYIL